MEVLISSHEKNFIIDGLRDGIRNDGRSTSDYRPISVETGVLTGSNGSARVQIGATDVLVGVKVDLAVVESAEELHAANRIRFFVDISANAAPRFAGRGGNEAAEEMAKTLSAAFEARTALPDMQRLVLAPTQLWVLYVDVVVLHFDGNAMDAISLGELVPSQVKAALADTEICNVVVRPADEGKILIDLPDELSTWRMDVSHAPLVIGVNRIGDQNVLDTDLMEEMCSNSTLYVGVQRHPDNNDSDGIGHPDGPLVVCMKKVRGGSLEVDSIQEMVQKAGQAVRQLNKTLMRRLEELGERQQTGRRRTHALFRSFH